MGFVDDEIIIESLFNRLQSALTDLQDKYANLIFKIADNVLQNPEDSEEILNDVLLTIWNSIPPDRPQILSAYISRITKNRAINMLKSKNAQKRGSGETAVVFEELEEMLPSPDNPEDNVNLDELKEAVGKYVRSLSKDKKIIFVGRYFYNEKIEDIVAKYGFSEGKVKMTLSRCRTELKSYLIEEGF